MIKSDYEKVIEMAYDGFIGDSIREKLNVNPSRLNKMMSQMKTSFSEIRKKKREGISLAQVIEGINWGFIGDAKKRSEASTAAGKANLFAYRQSKLIESELAEMKILLTDIYAALCHPSQRVG